MKRKIFISFLGTGPDGHGYTELDYKMAGYTNPISTEFVQRAEIEFIGKNYYDLIFILCTKESYKNFFHDLQEELRDQINIADEKIQHKIIKRIDANESAWQLFATVADLIQNGDQLTIDLTHGFRSLSIILSTALNFILKSKKDIVLEHVFYGQASDKQKGSGHIIEMKDFYIINEWADGVGRIVENADASKIAQIASDDTNTHFKKLNNPKLITALKHLTDTLKNIDVNRISQKTKAAVVIIDSFLADSSGEEKALLNLVKTKFLPLLINYTGKYDKAYFHLQLQIIRMLIAHNLYMQAFTVFRELVGSIGMLGAPADYTENMNDNEVADNRPQYADLFIRMINFSKFSAHEKEKERYRELKESIYQKIQDMGALDEFKKITKKFIKIRNGFDHAWTGKGDKSMEKVEDIEQTAVESLQFMEKLIGELVENKTIC